MQGVKLSEQQINIIANWSGESIAELAVRAGISKKTASQWKILIHGRSRGSHCEFERHKAILSKVESNPEIIECIEGEMEFNSNINTLMKICSKHLGLTWKEVEHCIRCLVGSRARKRWSNAVGKKERSSRIKPSVTAR